MARFYRLLSFQQVLRRRDHAGRAIAALQRVALLERGLQVGDFAGIGQAFDGFDLGAVALHRQHQAAAHDLAVDANGAGAADAVLAADMAAGQRQILAQKIDQGLARLDAFNNLFAVDGERNVDGMAAHEARLHQLRGHAAQQHAGEMLLHFAGGLHVVRRIEIERCDRGVDAAACQRRFGFPGAHGRGANAEKSQVYVIQFLAVGARAGGEADDGVIAVAARQFGETGARVLARRRHANGGQHILRPERGLEQTLEKILRPYGALALGPGRVDFGVERQQAGRQFGGRVGEGDRAPERATVADGGMTDMRYGARDQRRVFGDQLGTFGLRMAHQRAEFDFAVFMRNAAEPADAVDVDQQSGRRQPHVERGDQALPAGQQTRILLAEERNRFLDRARLFVGKWRRLHECSRFGRA